MEELISIIQSLDERPTREEIQEMMNDVDCDCDGNGTIDFDEFLNIMARKIKVNLCLLSTYGKMVLFSLNLLYVIECFRFVFLKRKVVISSLCVMVWQGNVAEELKEAFKVFDRNQDGYISANEVKTRSLHNQLTVKSFSLFFVFHFLLSIF